MKFRKRGFSLTELIIAVVIIAILSIVGVNIYKALLMRAISTEGKTLMGLIARAEKTYWVEYGEFYGFQGTQGQEVADEFKEQAYSDVLGFDARTNTYFKKITFTKASATELKVESAIEAPYEGLTVVLSIEDMQPNKEVKYTLKLYDMAHDRENTIDEEL